jgi:hypothetical protein
MMIFGEAVTKANAKKTCYLNTKAEIVGLLAAFILGALLF